MGFNDFCFCFEVDKKHELLKNISMATALRWIPDTLYNYSLAAVVANYNAYQEDTRSFSNNMLFDIYYKLYKEGHIKKLGVEFSDLDIFKKLLNVKDKRCLLHNCFQAVMDHGCPVASELAQSFQTLCSSASNSSNSTKNHVIKLGFSLGRFLLDAGWFPESDIVFSACLSLCYTCDVTTIWKYILHCHTKLLYIRNFYCKFEEGRRTFSEANEFIDKIKDLELEENFASIYSEFSFYYAGQHNYAETYRWSIEALKEVNSSLLPKDIVRILCQAAKACILKRKFKRSEMLIKQALRLAKDEFGSRNLCFAAAVEDYGYYLLSVDAIGPAVKAFQTALNLHIDVFGGNNLLVARCHENLAYASYSYGYSSGLFQDAMDHVDKALSIMLNLLDEDNFLLASAKRVKALILEEIALECHDLALQHKYFAEAQEFHTFALQLALEAFGELNIHTAKHYGNLGRLFQSMKKYKEAQNMQLKAIAIKESVLGPDDYEVGLSIGHLASLYTYDMELHKEAEALFLRSLEISRKLFGEGFSGLEYDYRGLLRVYTKLGLSDKILKYRTIFHEWKVVRDQTAQADIEFSPLSIESEPIAPEDIMEHFISIH